MCLAPTIESLDTFFFIWMQPSYSISSIHELESEKSLCLRDSVVNRYALTQPQSHRGTEAIFSASTHLHNSAKSLLSSPA